MKFTVEKNNAGARLDKFLVQCLQNLSRSQIQKRILAGEVTVNGKPTNVHQFLKEGDMVHVNIVNQESGVRSHGTILNNVAPKIIHEDPNYLVLDKPSGLLVHAAGIRHAEFLQSESTLVDWLIQKYPEIKEVGEQNYRAGIIHRLDREVSGAMLVARTTRMYEYLKSQFKERKIKKEYIALVYGQMPENEGKIDLPIGRNKEGKFVAHPRIENKIFQEDDKHALTLYRVEKEFEKASLLTVQILTGRTHQIRAHLSWLGNPIVGDKEYGPKKGIFRQFSKKFKALDAPRIMLHSYKIGFFDMNGEWKEFESPIPAEFKKFIE